MTVWIAFGLLCVVLLTAAVLDWRTHLIPNWLTYSAILAGLALAVGPGALEGGRPGAVEELKAASLATVAGFVPAAILFISGLGLGGGDAKLMGAVGALSASSMCVLGTAVYGFAVLFVVAVGVMIRHGIVQRTLRRIATAVFLLRAGQQPQFDEDSPRIPVALGICIGGILAGAEFMPLGVRVPWAGWIT